MQKVAWPITIVQSEGWIFPKEKNEASATPVTTPGSAIGRISRNETASRPKNRNRDTTAAAALPSTSAIAVAPAAAFSERKSASRASWLCHAGPNPLVENPEIGQLWMFDGLNA